MNKNNNISLFAVSFSQGFTSPNIPIASFQQGDKDIVFLLDTGSDNNVINKSALEYIDHQMYETPEDQKMTLSGVNGTTEVGHCSIQFGNEEENYKADFMIADLDEAFNVIKKGHCITIHGILGSKFLRTHNVVLDFKNLAAYSKQ
jgi:predicted aspartyl protease